MAFITRTAAQLRSEISRRGPADNSVALVPTMGALHEGHAALVSQAREENDLVVVSIFVNPLQFENLGDCEDYRNYPRQLDQDVALLSELGADIVFAPDTEAMYPDGQPMVWVRTGRLGDRLEGASRPGHFDGVATVVAKLFHLCRPDRAYFGQKDAQQVAVINRMVADLDFDVEVVPVSIIRAADGLAESSRNQRLSSTDRQHALALSQALFTLRDRAAAGQPLRSGEISAQLRTTAGVTLDHLEIVDPATLEPLADETVLGRPALALVAAQVGPVRLIDNLRLEPPAAS